MKKKRIKRESNKIDNILEFPKEIVTDMPKFTIMGFEEILIENYRGIMEYEDYYIKINTYIGIVNINGFNLHLDQMKDDTIYITGEIESLTLEKDFDN